jgi:hypothetical protein
VDGGAGFVMFGMSKWMQEGLGTEGGVADGGGVLIPLSGDCCRSCDHNHLVRFARERGGKKKPLLFTLDLQKKKKKKKKKKKTKKKKIKKKKKSKIDTTRLQERQNTKNNNTNTNDYNNNNKKPKNKTGINTGAAFARGHRGITENERLRRQRPNNEKNP